MFDKKHDDCQPILRFYTFLLLVVVCLLAVPKGLQAQTGQWTTNGNNINNTNSGNVGVNTASPTSRLHVFEPAGNGVSARITIQDGDSSAGFNVIAPSRTWSFVADNSPDGFSITSAGGANFFITNVGNVGIGTISPASKLHVVGDITATGNIAAKYQDLAEWVESSQHLVAGTVVVLDAVRSNQVVASTQKYDTRVAGVISAQPGITLGERGETKVLVATTGRVKIKVSTEGGPIAIGDLLVTSDQPGIAMKSQAVNVGGILIHRPGTLIGKALEPLAEGTGEILVLLSLQ